MTVKCITKAQKDLVIFWYQNKVCNQTDLALRCNVSERTINRVLIEAGIATPVARIKGEAYQAMQLLKQHGLDVQGLKKLLEQRNAA